VPDALDRPIRVTHVVFDLDGGGMESIVAALARRAAGTTVRVSVVTLSGREGRVGAALRPFLDDYRIVRPARGVGLLFPLAVARAVRATRPDVAHVHSGCWLKGAWGARLAGVPRVVFTEHGREHHDPPLARWIDRRAAGLTDAVVTVSDRLAAYVRDRLGVPESRVYTIENGVDTERFSPGEPAAPESLRVALALPPGALVVGSVGRLEAVKAYHRLIEAVGLMRADGRLARPVVLVIAGEGRLRSDLVAAAARLGLEDAVRLPGWIDDPPAIYRLFDVFALASDSEGLSMSLLEAMACGIVPVVTHVGSNREVVGDALVRQVVPPGDARALADRLTATLADDAGRREQSRLARERAVRRYSLARMASAYARVYRGLPPAGA